MASSFEHDSEPYDKETRKFLTLRGLSSGSGVVEYASLLEFYAMSSGKESQTFRRIVFPSSFNSSRPRKFPLDSFLARRHFLASLKACTFSFLTS